MHVYVLACMCLADLPCVCCHMPLDYGKGFQERFFGDSVVGQVEHAWDSEPRRYTKDLYLPIMTC